MEMDRAGGEAMTFEGFVPPTKNYFPVPNNWIDICATIRDISELKVIQYVIRHTWGFHEYGICKTISVDEFMHGRRRQDQTRMDCGTGLSEQGVRNGLNKAIKDGYLICEVDLSDAGRVKKSYALKMRTAELGVQSFDPVQTLDPPQSLGSGVQTLDPEVQTLGARGQKIRPRTEKDTIEKHLKKDTLERQESSATSLREDRTPAPVTDLHKWKEDSDKHKAISKEAVSSHSHADIGNDDDVPTVKLEAVKPSQQKPAASVPLSLAADPPVGIQDDAGSRQAPIPGAVSLTPARRSGVATSTDAAQGGKRTRKAVTQADEPVPMPKSDAREIQRRINEHRGYALEEKVQIIQERQAIKSWCNLHTIEEFEQVMHYLTAQDKYWKLEENKYRIGGVTLAKETPKALAARNNKSANEKTLGGYYYLGEAM
jgi:hypothetical protein